MKFGFLGCGNMGGALARAVSRSGNTLYLSDHDTAKAQALSKELGATFSDNETVCRECDYIYIAVKPQFLGGLYAEISPVLKSRKTPFVLVSMAAGVSMASILEGIGKEVPLIRIMPNMPASIGKGTILYCTNGVGEQEEKIFLEAMSAAGLLDPIPEQLIDAASAVSGCGPAFVYLFLEALADGAVLCGLPRDKALRYASSTVAGSAELLLQSGGHPGTWKDAVCSPGGTTIAGVRKLEEGAFRAATMNAVIAAYEKTVSLGKK